MDGCLRVSLSISLYLYISILLVLVSYVEWFIRQLWCFVIIFYNITSIAHNLYTNIYPLLNSSKHIHIHIHIHISTCTHAQPWIRNNAKEQWTKEHRDQYKLEIGSNFTAMVLECSVEDARLFQIRMSDYAESRQAGMCTSICICVCACVCICVCVWAWIEYRAYSLISIFFDV